jgi:hypothetical protein
LLVEVSRRSYPEGSTHCVVSSWLIPPPRGASIDVHRRLSPCKYSTVASRERLGLIAECYFIFLNRSQWQHYREYRQFGQARLDRSARSEPIVTLRNSRRLERYMRADGKN